MTCKLCESTYSQSGQDSDGDYPTCAFSNGKFVESNWNCATMNSLRDLIGDGTGGNYTSSFRDRYDDCSIGVLRAPNGWHLVMTWYKERGCTGDAFLVRDGLRTELTETIAEAIIEMYSNPTLIKTT